jgi:7-carboxy-7-deazaguanine synthase
MKIVEIFSSINGEICNQHQGSLCTFIRLAGCNFEDSPCWGGCDTPYALSKDSGVKSTIPGILDEVKNLENKNVTITGGEPLFQKKALLTLCRELIKSGYSVSVETNGSYSIPDIDARINWVIDYKLPSSGNEEKMIFYNSKCRLNLLEPEDILKFVVKDLEDFERALIVIGKLCRNGNDDYLPTFAFSPKAPELTPEALLKWMQSSPFLKNLRVVLSIQIHKILQVR